MNTSSKLQPSLFPLRLFLLYSLWLGLIPTIGFWIDFGNIEATEENWDSSVVFSVIVSVPLVTASWIAIRNFSQVPILTAMLAFFTVFHLWGTACSCKCGLLGEPYSDPGLSRDAFVRYFEIFGIQATPFLIAYLVWCFWFLKARTSESASPA
jgi:hypothetical protein